MGYFVYILQSLLTDKYYVGSSENPERRLEFHNTIEKGFTSRFRPWRIIYKKEYPNKPTAQTIERRIKKWKSRLMIEKLLNGKVEI